MKEHNTQPNQELNVVEDYKEEGALTLETLEVASHDAETKEQPHSHSTHKEHPHKSKGFTLTTPMAIIIAAVIISGGLMGYGAITSNGSTTSSSNPLPKILKDLKINKKAFVSCVTSGDTAAQVKASLQDGSVAGVNGTPSTFIIKEQDGIQYVVALVDGARPAEFFKQAIDQALSSTSVTKLQRFKGRPITASDLQEGDSPAKVYVVEYSDAECPFCIALHNTMKQMRTDYAGKITFVYRSFPLPFHQHAQKEAEMIACAGKLGGTKAMYGFIDSSFDFKVKSNIGYMTLEN